MIITFEAIRICIQIYVTPTIKSFLLISSRSFYIFLVLTNTLEPIIGTKGYNYIYLSDLSHQQIPDILLSVLLCNIQFSERFLLLTKIESELKPDVHFFILETFFLPLPIVKSPSFRPIVCKFDGYHRLDWLQHRSA